MEFESTPEVEKERVRVTRQLATLRAKTSSPEVEELYRLLLDTVTHFGRNVSPQDFVEAYIRNHNIEIHPNGIFKNGHIVKNHKVLFHRIYQDWKRFRRVNKIKDVMGREDIALEFESISEDDWIAKRKTLQAKLQPQPNEKRFKALLEQLIEAMCGVIAPDPRSPVRRRYMAFMGHFLWQLQMKLHFGPESVLRQGNEALLLIYSRTQKTGKSTAVRRLLKPILECGMVWKTDFERLMDPFSLQNLVYNYVSWFDDAGRAGIRNMEKFKQLVTESEVSFRAIYSQTEMKLPKFSVLIATSNKPCRELMHDTSGLRRFHQIEVNSGKVHDGTGIDLDALRDFPFEELIRATPIGETASPLYEYLTPEELDAYEEEQRPKHAVELWLQHHNYAPGPQGDVMPIKQLYDSLLKWCADNGYKNNYVPTSTSFTARLSEMGFERGRTAKFRGFIMCKGEQSCEAE